VNPGGRPLHARQSPEKPKTVKFYIKKTPISCRKTPISRVIGKSSGGVSRLFSIKLEFSY
jgi:hypothetical protein